MSTSTETTDQTAQVETTELPPVAYETFANFDDYCTARFCPADVKENPIPNKPGQKYKAIQLFYNIGTLESKVLADCCIQLPEMYTPVGIVWKPNQEATKDVASMMSRFNSDNEEHNQLESTLTQFYNDVAQTLHKNKMKAGMKHFDLNNPEALLKPVIYRQVDKETGEYVEGKSPALFMNLLDKGGRKAVFTDIDDPDTPMPWKNLENVEMTYIPLLKFERVYIGTKASIQFYIESAVVTSCKPSGSSTKQTVTINRLRQTRPDLTGKVQGQMARITSSKQDSILNRQQTQTQTKDEHPDEEPDNGDAEPTFSGVTKQSDTMANVTASAPTRRPAPRVRTTNATQLS
jgi:hypothetical protein